MKKLLMMLCLVAATGLAAKAQTNILQKSPEQRAEKATRMLTKRLNLTANQAAKVNTIMLTRATRIDSLIDNRSADNKKLNAMTRREIRLNTEKQMLAVLNEDQQKKYIQLKENLKEKVRARKQQQPAEDKSQG